MNLKDIKPGKTVKIGNEKFTVLKHLENGVLCIRDNILDERRAFDVKECNNWSKSSLREYLNGEWLQEFVKNIDNTGIDGELIYGFESDLTTDDGMKDYGTSIDKVFLLSCDQYREFRHLFRKLDASWWLITGDSLIFSHLARHVRTDGTLSHYSAYDGSHGVRPACVFNPSILIKEEGM